ncbi:MAG: YidC/Oxa1 family insertase periplasmic-domain containing protein, partial [Bacteroidota bacterium]
MDRNSIIGLLLIGLVLITFSLWNAPSEQEKAERQRIQDSLKLAEQPKEVIAPEKVLSADTLVAAALDTTGSPDSVKNIAQQNRYGLFAAAANGTETFSNLENDELRVTFTNKGGRVHSVELKKYKTYDGKPLTLFESDSTKFAFSFFSQNKDITTSDFYYTLHKESPGALTYRLYAGQSYIEHTYRLPKTGFMLDFSMVLSGMEKVIAPNLNFIALDWQQNIYKKEKSQKAEASNSTVYYK